MCILCQWNFNRSVRVQIYQHQILIYLKEYGYSGIDKSSKVHHLLLGIKIITLDAIKTQIIVSYTLRSNFDFCVTLYTDFISQARTNSADQTLLIAGISDAIPQGGGKKRKRSGAGDGGG